MPPADESEQPIAPARVPSGALAWTLRVVGAIAGLGLLAWCGVLALSGENRDALRRLEDAPLGLIAVLIVLSIVIIAANAVQLRCALAPIQRMSCAYLVAVNVVITALNFLPFRIGTISRVVIHARRDAMPVTTIGAWLVAFAFVTAAVLGPAVLISAVHPRVDAVWILGVSAALIASFVALVLVAGRGARWRASERHEDARLLGSPSVQRLMSAADMVASPRWTALGMLCRVAEVGLQAARFVVAGMLIGYEIEIADAVLIASTYFVVGLVSPFGQAGFREMAVVWLANSDEFAIIALLVTAAEAVTSTVLAAPIAFTLRLDRVFWAGSRSG